MRTLRISEAAAYLSVSPNTLRAWERRFGYPRPYRSPGNQRVYAHGELAPLREALNEGLTISSAISAAREAVGSDLLTLVAPLVAFHAEQADLAMERALALRSVERAVLQVLLPSLHQVGRRHGTNSAPWGFAIRWAAEWLGRAQRLAAQPAPARSVLVGDGTRDGLDVDVVYARALELFCVRTGVRVLSLPVLGCAALADAVAAAVPGALVLTGRGASDEEIGRWAYAVRVCAGPLPCVLYRRPVGPHGLGRRLPGSPLGATRELLALLERPRAGFDGGLTATSAQKLSPDTRAAARS